jgi:hypothetical protein
MVRRENEKALISAVVHMLMSLVSQTRNQILESADEASCVASGSRREDSKTSSSVAIYCLHTARMGLTLSGFLDEAVHVFGFGGQDIGVRALHTVLWSHVLFGCG